MSTSDEQHPTDAKTPGGEISPDAGTGATRPAGASPTTGATTPAGASPTTGATTPAGDSPATGAPAEAPQVPAPAVAPAPAPESRPSPVPPAPVVGSSGPPTSPALPTRPNPTPGATTWQPPAPATPLGAPAPMRPPLPAPALADEEAVARHASVRPNPAPPGPAPVPSTPGVPPRVPSTPAPAGANPGAGAATTAGALGLAAGAGAATAAAGRPAGAAGTTAGTTAGVTPAAASTGGVHSSTELFPDPNAPRTITVGTHVLGVLVGLVLPAASALVTLLGVSRILAVEADGWVAKVDVLGIVLVTLGALLLLACALLALWTPSVGLVGGTLLTLAGAFALYAPGVTHTAVLRVLSSDGWRPTLVQTVTVATSGTLLVAGVLLLAAGIVSAVARSHGIHLGAFRERHRA